jgi:nucleoside-diphosphate-sugar epimerase
MLEHKNTKPTAPERTVVLGSHGFVGAALMRRLEKEEVPALGLARSDIDLLRPDAADKLAAVLRPTDALVAVAAIAPCKNLDMLIDNMRLAKAIAEALARAPVAHVVNISSDAVYADGPLPLSEASPVAPTTLHGVMHLAREIALAEAASAAPFATLRPTLIYGASDPHNGYGPNRFRRLAAEGKDIVLFGEGEERRDHVLVDDVAEVILRVLLYRSSGALNIATGTTHSFRSIAEQVAGLAGNGIAIKGSPRSGPMPHNGYRPFDVSSLKSAFPDFDYTPLPDGLAKAQRDAAGMRHG